MGWSLDKRARVALREKEKQASHMTMADAAKTALKCEGIFNMQDHKRLVPQICAAMKLAIKRERLAKEAGGPHLSRHL